MHARHAKRWLHSPFHKLIFEQHFFVLFLFTKKKACGMYMYMCVFGFKT